MPIVKTKSLTYPEAKSLAGFLSSSFQDYISARILFNHNQLISAASLANTAIEKYFKAIIAFRGNRVKAKHDLEKLLPSIKSFSPEVYKEINVEFLKMLSKTYCLRYIDDLETNFNIVISKNKYLAELDYTYSILEPKLRLSDKKDRKSSYEIAIEEKDPTLWTNNYILNGIDKTRFIERDDVIHEFRMLPDESFIEAVYHTEGSKNDGIFNHEAVKPERNM